MIRIETELFIATSPEKIWSILTDFEKFGEWNELLPRVNGNCEKGAKILVRMRNPDNSGRLQGYYPRITINEENKMLAWKYHLFMLPGIFDGVHYFRLAPAGNGTLLTHGATYSGFLANSMRQTILKKYPISFEQMNIALANRCGE